MRSTRSISISRRPRESFLPNPQAPLRRQLQEVLRFFHYSERTEQTRWNWRNEAIALRDTLTTP